MPVWSVCVCVCVCLSWLYACGYVAVVPPLKQCDCCMPLLQTLCFLCFENFQQPDLQFTETIQMQLTTHTRPAKAKGISMPARLDAVARTQGAC